MRVVGNKKTNIKNNSFPPCFPRLNLTSPLLPDSFPPPLLSLQVTLSPSPFREEASCAKGALRGYDQDVVVSVCRFFLLTPFSSSSMCPSQAAGNICSIMERLILQPWGSICSFSLFFPSFSLCLAFSALS